LKLPYTIHRYLPLSGKYIPQRWTDKISPSCSRQQKISLLATKKVCTPTLRNTDDITYFLTNETRDNSVSRPTG
jgi:hypothetical protein